MQLAPQQRRALSSALKEHLKEKQLSFSAFSGESGINSNTISRLTHPDKFDRVQTDTRKKLERAMGAKFDALIGGHDAASHLVHRANGNGRAMKPANDPASAYTAKRMLVIELCGSRINIPAGVEVSILDSSTIRVR